jgi:hypothetical protein
VAEATPAQKGGFQMSMGPGPGGSFAPPTAEALEAQRLERTRPKPMMEGRQFARWCLNNPRRPKETEGGYQNRYLASLPRGDSRVICNIVCVPTGKKAAKGRRPYHATRSVDRKVWAKLSADERSRYIDRIRAEVGA